MVARRFARQTNLVARAWNTALAVVRCGLARKVSPPGQFRRLKAAPSLVSVMGGQPGSCSRWKEAMGEPVGEGMHMTSQTATSSTARWETWRTVEHSVSQLMFAVVFNSPPLRTDLVAVRFGRGRSRRQRTGVDTFAFALSPHRLQQLLRNRQQEQQPLRHRRSPRRPPRRQQPLRQPVASDVNVLRNTNPAWTNARASVTMAVMRLAMVSLGCVSAKFTTSQNIADEGQSRFFGLQLAQILGWRKQGPR